MQPGDSSFKIKAFLPYASTVHTLIDVSLFLLLNSVASIVEFFFAIFFFFLLHARILYE